MAKKYNYYSAYVARTGGSRAVKAILARFNAVQSILYVVDDNGTEVAFRIRFPFAHYLYGDVLRVLRDFAAGTATPLPLALTYADPIRDPGVSALVKSGVSLANKAVAGLNDLTQKMQGALDAGVIPASLYQEVEDAKAQIVDAVTSTSTASSATAKTNEIRKVKVNLLDSIQAPHDGQVMHLVTRVTLILSLVEASLFP